MNTQLDGLGSLSKLQVNVQLTRANWKLLAGIE